jgi:DNA-binding beta-propeller fold protein YncE
MVLPNPGCTHVAVANEAEGVDGPDGTLVDPEGSVSIIDLSDNSVQTISLNTKADGTALTDTMMVDMDIHMPLTQNAMRYFDRINDDINWTAAISSYTVATQLEPEYLAWSPDGSKIYVNLQHW